MMVFVLLVLPDLLLLMVLANKFQPVLVPNIWMPEKTSVLIALFLLDVLLEVVDLPTHLLSADLLGNTQELLKDNIPMSPQVLLLNTEPRLNIIWLLSQTEIPDGAHVTLLTLGARMLTLLEFHLDLVSATALEKWISVISKPSSTSLLELKSPLPLSNSP